MKSHATAMLCLLPDDVLLHVAGGSFEVLAPLACVCQRTRRLCRGPLRATPVLVALDRSAPGGVHVPLEPIARRLVLSPMFVLSVLADSRVLQRPYTLDGRPAVRALLQRTCGLWGLAVRLHRASSRRASAVPMEVDRPSEKKRRRRAATRSAWLRKEREGRPMRSGFALALALAQRKLPICAEEVATYFSGESPALNREKIRIVVDALVSSK